VSQHCARLFRAAATVAALSSVLLIAASVDEGEAKRLVSISVATCDIECEECIPTTWHSTTTGGNRMGMTHSCISAACDQPVHRVCAPDDDLEDVDVEDAAVAFLSADGSREFSDLMNRFRGVASYNPQRRSMQLLGCDLESVVANIPLTEAQITALLD
jgi:hypothetical protein